MSDPANDKLDALIGEAYGKSPVEAAREELDEHPEWAIEALRKGERVTVRGLHRHGDGGPPFEDFEEAVEHFKEEMDVDDPEGMAGAMMTRGEVEVDNNLQQGGRADRVARTRTAGVTHPNCRSTWVGPEDDRTNITVDGDIDDVEGAVREAVEKIAEETVERSKNLLKR